MTKDGDASPTTPWVWSVSAIVLVAALAAASEIFEFFEVSAGWRVGRTVVLAVIAYFGAHAVEVTDLRAKNRWLWLTVAGLFVLVAGIGVYSATQEVSSHEFIVDVESETQMLRPSAEPGGPQLIFLPALEGQQSYRFVCKVALSDGSIWFRLHGEPTSFVHEAFLRRPNGLEPVTLPDC